MLTVGLFENKDLTTANIRSEAANRGLVTPNAEIACLVRENFTNKQIKAMELTGICVMHSPLTSWTGDVPLLLGADTLNDKSFLVSLPDQPQFKWNSGAGFAFVVP